jgi:hypothetical protein
MASSFEAALGLQLGMMRAMREIEQVNRALTEVELMPYEEGMVKLYREFQEKHFPGTPLLLVRAQNGGLFIAGVPFRKDRPTLFVTEALGLVAEWVAVRVLDEIEEATRQKRSFGQAS